MFYLNIKMILIFCTFFEQSFYCLVWQVSNTPFSFTYVFFGNKRFSQHCCRFLKSFLVVIFHYLQAAVGLIKWLFSSPVMMALTIFHERFYLFNRVLEFPLPNSSCLIKKFIVVRKFYHYLLKIHFLKQKH